MLKVREGTILTTKDREEWDRLVQGTPCRDVFFRPDYARLFESLSGDGARAFLFGEASDYVIYPFFLRRVNDLPFFRARPLDGETVYHDIVSPYGYSGPLARLSHPEREEALWRGFLAAFHAYCQETRIVCEFARLNPFVGNHRPLQALTEGVTAASTIVCVDLRQSPAEIWRGLNRGNRSNIHKARQHGVTIRTGAEAAWVERFYALYVETMRRNEASEWYYFSPTFFADTFALLHGKVTLLSAWYEDEMIAAASFLHDGDAVHYFLGGSASERLELRPNNLLMYEAICWARAQGYRWFNLGGGYHPGDNLSRFKAGFSELSMTFYTYRAVHDVALYAELNARHRAYQQAMGQPQGDGHYFPQYRS